MRLLKEPAQIVVGEIVRRTETDFRIVECFDEGTNACLLSPTCRLKRVFDAAMQAYFKVLDGVTLVLLGGDGPGRAAGRSDAARRPRLTGGPGSGRQQVAAISWSAAHSAGVALRSHRALIEAHSWA